MKIETTPDTRTLRAPAVLLGISLGGFFDGILLHQVLQWHHLLSNVEAVEDMRGQVLADGLFHVLMYLLAVVALAMLWKRRALLSCEGAGRRVWSCALIGFGAWHLVDAVLSHWILGIHRIRDDSPVPLVWDLLWFVVFGLLPVALGWLSSQRQGGGPRHGRAVTASLAVAAVIAAPLAALPSGDSDQLVVLFPPWMSAASAFGALSDADARVLWVDASGGVWAVTLADADARRRLYRNGALLVSNSPIAFGCLSWSKAGPAS